MIDYEKLKILHDKLLQFAIDNKTVTEIMIEFNQDISIDLMFNWYEKGHLREHCFIAENIDEVIEDFELITKSMEVIETKYNIDQKVWVIDEDSPLEIRICDIDYYSEEKYLDDYGNWWLEEQLYPTSRVLIEKQIHHWQDLFNNCNK